MVLSLNLINLLLIQLVRLELITAPLMDLHRAKVRSIITVIEVLFVLVKTVRVSNKCKSS